jgi:hypothetical protein
MHFCMAGLLSSAVPPAPGSSERKIRIAMLRRSLLRNKTRQTRPRPFLKGEGGVMRVLHIRVEVLYIFPACCVAE